MVRLLSYCLTHSLVLTPACGSSKSFIDFNVWCSLGFQNKEHRLGIFQ